MRMRFKPYAHDELMAADFHVHEPLIWGGRWHAQYARPEQPRSKPPIRLQAAPSTT